MSPHLGGELTKVMVAADVFSDPTDACDMVGLAKISNVMKDYIITNMVCTWIRKPVEKKSTKTQNIPLQEWN